MSKFYNAEIRFEEYLTSSKRGTNATCQDMKKEIREAEAVNIQKMGSCG